MRAILMTCLLAALAAAAGGWNQGIPALGGSRWSTSDINATGTGGSSTQPIGAVTGNGTIYVLSSGWSSAGYLTAFNGTSGAVLWQNNTWNPKWVSFMGSYIYVATTTYVAALTANGATRWNFTFADNYIISNSLPVWLDADCFVVFVSYSNDYSRLIHFNADSGTPMILWNSTVAYPGDSYMGLYGSATVGTIGSSVFVVQYVQSSRFVVINISNATASMLVSYGTTITNTNYMSQIFNGTIYLAGQDYSTSMAKIAGWAPNGTRVFQQTYSGATGIKTFTRFRLANGTEGFAVIGTSSSVCKVWSTNAAGAAATPMITVNTYYQYCYLAAQDSGAFYVTDDHINVFQYSFGASNWTWGANSLLGTGSSYYNTYPAVTAIIVNNTLYFQVNTYLNGSSSLDGNFVAISTVTGMYNFWVPTPRSSSYQVSMLLYDAYTPMGSIVGVGESNSAGTYAFAIYLSAGTSQGSWLAQSSGLGQPIVSNDKVYFTTYNTMYCFGALNGTLMWSQYVDSTYSYTFDQTVAPIVVGRWLYAKSYYSSTIYVFDYLNRVPVVTYTIPSTITNCLGSTSSITQFVQDFTDPTSEFVYWAGGSGYCVVQLKYVGGGTTGFTIGAAKSTYSVYQPPVVGVTHVWYVDYQGYLYWQLKSQFTAAPTVLTNMKTTSTIPGSYPSPIVAYKGNVYFSCSGMLYSYGGTTLIQQFKNTVASVDDTAAPVLFNNQVFVTTTNGSLVSFKTAGITLTLPIRFYVSGPAGFGTTNLGKPVVAPFGVFVFANTNGIVAWDWNGNLKFAITRDLSGYALSCSAPVAYRTGVAYVVCNRQLQLVDVIRGVIFMTGPAFASSWTSPTIVVDTASPYYSNVFTIYGPIASVNNVTALYTPSQLPAALDAPTTIVEELEQNKIWIAGLVAGLIVIIIIIAVAVKVCGGSKKDTDYVAMNAPVNRGGV